MTDIIFDIVMTIVWTVNAVMFARLARVIYIRRRYGGMDNYRIARFNRAFERFKCL